MDSPASRHELHHLEKLCYGEPGSSSSGNSYFPAGSPILFLSKTKCDRKRIEYVKVRLGFNNCYVVPGDGRSEGIALFWMNETPLRFLNASAHYIKLRSWDSMGFTATSDQYKSWELLRSLSSFSALPWLIFRDFNEVLLASEKIGGRVRSSSQMQRFQDAVAYCNLGDLGFSGELFTWANSITKCQLDQCLANADWRTFFGHSNVLHLNPLTSDHVPILL